MNVALLQHSTHPSMGRVMGQVRVRVIGQVRVRVIGQVKERLKENVGLLGCGDIICLPLGAFVALSFFSSFNCPSALK